MAAQANRVLAEGATQAHLDDEINILDVDAYFPLRISSSTIQSYCIQVQRTCSEMILKSAVFWRNNRPWRLILQIQSRQRIRLSLDLLDFPVLSSFDVRIIYCLMNGLTSTGTTKSFDHHVECGLGGRLASWTFDPTLTEIEFSSIDCYIKRIDSPALQPRPKRLRVSQEPTVASTEVPGSAEFLVSSSTTSSTVTSAATSTHRQPIRRSDREMDHGESSDLFLCTRTGRKIRVQKTVITSRSPVLAQLCRNRSEVDLSDMTDAAAEAFVHFMYHNQVSADLMLADLLELFLISKKYQVPELSAQCLHAIENSVAIANAANILIFADDHGLEDLKSKAMIFINRHVSRVKETIGFRKLRELHLSLIDELYNNLISSSG